MKKAIEHLMPGDVYSYESTPNLRHIFRRHVDPMEAWKKMGRGRQELRSWYFDPERWWFESARFGIGWVSVGLLVTIHREGRARCDAR